MDYKNAGVDIEAGYKSVELMKEHVKKTMRPEVLGGLGGFSGAFSLAKIKEMEEPVLLSGTDGCGTKVKLAMVGEIDDSITFKFKELSKQDEMTQAQGLSARIGALTMLKDRNAISADELREAVKGDEASGLSFLTGEAPDEEDEMQTDDPMASLFGGASKVDTPSKPDATPQEVTNAQPQSEDQNG